MLQVLNIIFKASGLLISKNKQTNKQNQGSI